MTRDDFWSLHPSEFWWLAEAHRERQEVQTRKSSKVKLTKSEAKEMQKELQQARIKAGYPAE